MSRYVQPASKAAWKIGGLKRGSAALRIDVAALRASELRDRRSVGRVELRRAEALVPEPVDERLRTRGIEIREDDSLEEIAPRGDRSDGRADAPGANDEDSQGIRVPGSRVAASPLSAGGRMCIRSCASARTSPSMPVISSNSVCVAISGGEI